MNLWVQLYASHPRTLKFKKKVFFFVNVSWKLVSLSSRPSRDSSVGDWDHRPEDHPGHGDVLAAEMLLDSSARAHLCADLYAGAQPLSELWEQACHGQREDPDKRHAAISRPNHLSSYDVSEVTPMKSQPMTMYIQRQKKKEGCSFFSDIILACQ
jgi:hypothetical protein